MPLLLAMTHDELLQLIDRAAEEGWQELDLAGHDLEELPPQMGKLTQLKTLILGKWDQEERTVKGNKLNTLPAEIGQLTSLRSLDLRSNSLTTLPAEIGQLANLQSLYIRSNSLTTLPAEIGQLANLRSLYLSYNALTTLPAEIGQLANLRSLYLSYNALTTLPAEISQLTNLQSLDLSYNSLSILPAELSQLTSLQSLDLSYNSLSTLPVEVIQLTSLQSLDLSYNSLSTLPAEVIQLTSLQSLDLSYNSLSTLPAEIVQLANLESLGLRYNSLSTLPAEVVQLTSLRSLDLSDNSLSTLPTEIKQLSNLEKLDLRGNPVPIPPEILGPKELYKDPGEVQAILDFYFQVQDPGETEPLYEAKLLIVGEGGAGKTSLAKKIQDEDYELDSQEESTEGIEVVRWSFAHPSGQEFRVNLWDFGGQEIYHATHQFFLTKRSFYVLVADMRKENTDFFYWLKAVELLSDRSPVIIVKNKKQDRQYPINESQLRGEFINLKEVLGTNLKTNEGLTEIRDIIQHYVSHLPHVGTPLPKVWVRVRAALENYAQHCNYISLETYFELCKQNGFTDRQQMLNLSSYLHDLGVCLHFQTDDLLKRTVILKPEWGTRAVYKVLDTPKVKANYGRFTRDDLTEIWSDAEYADMCGELLRLMMNFKLCYEIRDQPNHYISPQLLDIEQPAYEWDANDNLILRYKYGFMPKGILIRFIVEMHRSVEQLSPEHSLVWKEGVILNNGRARAEVIEYGHKGEIRIRIAGHDQKGLLAVIDHEFEKIHRSYERLKYKTLVPCNCSSCKGSQAPHFFVLKVLQKFLDDKQDQIQCQSSYEMVRVRNLVDDMNLSSHERPSQQSKEISKPKTVSRNQVFVSYSHHDESWLRDLKTHLKPFIRNQTISAWDDTNIEAGDEWRREVETALAAASVAVLLVSPNFLASDFIAEQELPPLLAAAESEGLTIIWIPIRYSSYEETDIQKYQAAHPPNQPLASLDAAAQDQAWVNICRKIKAAASS